jgi:uncharacterized membrane protein YhhN
MLPAALLLLLTLIEFAAEIADAPNLIFLSKSTLLPLLAWTYARAVPAPTTAIDRRMRVAFAGSWVGDVALMLAPAHPGDVAVLGLPKHELWFLVGVCAFLVCHLALIGVFRDVDRPQAPAPLPARWPWLVPLALYLVTLGSFLVPRVLADPTRSVAAGPVLVYASVLCTMVVMALQRYGRVAKRSFALTAAGAVVFLVSDSLIALVHLARVPIPLPGLAIMVTYITAEVLIAAGVAVQRRGAA